MNKILKLACLLSVFSLLSACTAAIAPSIAQSAKPRNTNPQVNLTEMSTLVLGNTAFALNLYQTLIANPQAGNLFYSPYSISTALAMAQAGASGETLSQMNAALRYNLPADRLHLAFNSLVLNLAATGKNRQDPNKPDDFKLNVANATWGQAGYKFLPAYLDILAENYSAGLRLLDFKSDPEKSRTTINDWVAQQTEQKITNLLQQGAITPLTRLVLTNAIYFNAGWSSPFQPENTKDGTFIGLDGKQVSVPMMNLQDSFGYYKGNGYQSITLPYINIKLSMHLVLPDAGKFNDVEKSFSQSMLDDISQRERSQGILLALPKFKVESDFSLKDALSSLGMTDAFDPAKADFSLMDGTRDLSISDVVHKAYVSVDEKGTEAAAATAVVIAKLSMPTQTVQFTVDRPFFFIIQDNATGTILFIGRVVSM